MIVAEVLLTGFPSMDPIDVMMNEHQRILLVLACLEKMVWRMRNTAGFDEGAARDMIRFFRGYAEGSHLQKEEQIYFPALDRKGWRSNDLVREHLEGRQLIETMEAAIPEAAAEKPESLDRFRQAASQFIFTLRRHIRKEDNFLFPAGDMSFNAAELAEIEKRFEEVDRQSAGERAELLALADRLADAFGVAKDRAHFGSGAI